jgi:hypothetical protein
MKKFVYRGYLLVSLLMMVHVSAMAQHQEITEKPDLWKGKRKQSEDTLQLLHAFKKGQVHGHFRYFAMATDNQGALSDYFAHAAGGGIKFETAPFKGFQLGVSGFFVFNLYSSDFTRPDSSTQLMNRYEVALFDVTNAANKNNIDRLEELYLSYRKNSFHITVGKQLLNTPFINLQDGRMRPTEVGGVFATGKITASDSFECGYLYQVSPRSTVDWYTIGESIGLYAQGVNPNGEKGNYRGNISSRGIGLLGYSKHLKKNWALKVYDTYVDQVFNTLLLQTDYRHRVKKNHDIVTAVQWIIQQPIKNGGNEDPAKTYFQKGEWSQTFGIKLGWEHGYWNTSINYNRITAHGRYLMPREWGREPFFTFLPRERNEGLADVHALVLKTQRSFPKAHTKAQVGAGYYRLPSVYQFEANKYGMPSYAQLNIDLRHEFTGFLKGMEVQGLWVYKMNLDHNVLNNKFRLNKVDMSNWNLVLNYHF